MAKVMIPALIAIGFLFATLVPYEAEAKCTMRTCKGTACNAAQQQFRECLNPQSGETEKEQKIKQSDPNLTGTVRAPRSPTSGFRNKRR